MTHRFNKHYTRDEANALLPEIRRWLAQLDLLLELLERQEQQLSNLLATGNDAGGRLVNGWVRTVAQIKDVLTEFEQREILLKDVSHGVIDFPAFLGGREVFLCWERDEESVEYWHELDTGFAGRKRL